MHQQAPRLRAFRLIVFACIALPSFFSSAFAGDRKRSGSTADNNKDVPTAPDWAPPADWTASARVNAFLQTYLETDILAPLDSLVPSARGPLGTLNIDFASRLATAQLPSERALYSDATGLCNLLTQIIDARERQQVSLLNSRNGGNAVNPLDMPATAVSGHYSWRLEAERERAQGEQNVQAQLNALDKKNFFVVTELRQWTNQLPAYRQSIQKAAININAAQIRLDREHAAANPSPSAAQTVAGAPGSTPAPAATGKP